MQCYEKRAKDNEFEENYYYISDYRNRHYSNGRYNNTNLILYFNN